MQEASTEAKFLRKLSGTGIAPELIRQEGSSIIMERIEGLLLSEYVRTMNSRGAVAPRAIQESMIRVLQILHERSVNPNDSNLRNYIVNEDSQRVYRIDFAAGRLNQDVLDNLFMLASKIYKVFPEVIRFLKPSLQAQITPEWARLFGYE